ncbi:MAG: serine peptidase, partial [Comamonas sp.]
MRTPAWMTLKSRVSATALASALTVAAAAGVAVFPVTAAHAQSAGAVRGLPDFTDLVDQVGPSVVNIRTLEKVSNNAGEALGMDEDMLE